MKRLALLLVLSCTHEEPAVTIASPPSAPATASATVTVTAVATASPPVTTCIEIDQDNLTGKETSIDGVVACGEHSHPNGSQFKFCYLKLDAPRCVKGMSEHASVDEVQLAGDPDFVKLAGQRIRVRGEPFPEHTAWHVRPVLVMVKSFDRL